MNIFPSKDSDPSKKDLPRLKVRLTVESYRTTRGVAQKRELYFFKVPNPAQIVDCFYEDLSNGNDLEDLIINLDQKINGVYELRTCNVKNDWESGYAEEWDWELVEWVD